MLKFDSTTSWSTLGAVFIAILSISVMYGRAETQLQTMSSAIVELKQNIQELNVEVVKLRIEMAETRAGLNAHVDLERGIKK